MDGKGYPHGLSENDIPDAAKILAVADAYDAMTSDRAYRPGMPTERAISILQDGRGQQWDSGATDAFVTSISENVC
jgi:HD-GYP domain-containing protein (c-di-GMP phosphodiesterase class II)